MPALHTRSSPKELPFHADSFGWDAFERFCGAWLVSGTTLPNLNLASNPKGPARLRIVDAVRLGTSGEKQHGIDILVRMETGTQWVVQCKHVKRFRKTELTKAVDKAQSEFGIHKPEHFLLWVTGTVTGEATLLVEDKETYPNWTLWSAERMTNEFILHTPPRQCFTILQQCFDHSWAKAFFPVPDDLLISAQDFFARWDGPDRIFHHHAELIGRENQLQDLVAFARGGAGTKVLILTAPGGVGKSRLLKAAALQAEGEDDDRSVLFVNPDASPDADLPRYQDLSKLTVIHDDAHRADMPDSLLPRMADQKSSGSRLILSTRPGAENSLRERLMNVGYQSKDISCLELKKLSRPAMVQLAASIMGDLGEDAARTLAELSGGCVLITVVGAELLRKGELKNLDLQRSEHFANEVFIRFEGQELDRGSASFDRGLLEKLLRAIALLSPWQGKDARISEQMANFLGVPRGLLDSARDSLQQCGLLVTTHEGMRVTPDLFSDHLVYKACYGDKGKPTEFIAGFLAAFGKASTNEAGTNETNTIGILRNLAEAQWRAIQQHGQQTANIVAPLWQQVLRGFEVSTFWERSLLLEKWKDFAIYLPEESIELAGWAMDLKTSASLPDYESINTHDRVLNTLPHILKPIAIWNDEYRQSALHLLWKLERHNPPNEKSMRKAFEAFAEISSFRNNFPQASSGVLDWVEQVLQTGEGSLMADSPSELLNIILRPYFARVIEVSYWQDRRTCMFEHRPVSIPKTKSIRHRAMDLMGEHIIPRGTVATINVLPVLGEAMRAAASDGRLSPRMMKSWLPERKLALNALKATAELHQNHWVHFVIRKQVQWHIVYGKDDDWRNQCLQILDLLPDTFEMKLARLTLSDAHHDSMERYDGDRRPGWYEKQRQMWHAMLKRSVSEFLKNFTDSTSSKNYLEEWSLDAKRHGFEAKLGELLFELAQQNQKLAFSILDRVLEDKNSYIAGVAANLLHPEGMIEANALSSLVRRGLASQNQSISSSFLNVIRFSPWLQTPENIAAILELAKTAEGNTLSRLIGMLSFPREQFWICDITSILAHRALDNEQTNALASAMAEQESHGDTKIGDDAIDALIERLVLLPELPFVDGEGYLYWLAEKHPARLYQLLQRRIKIAESAPTSSSDRFTVMPFYHQLSLDGLVDEPDFEELAKGLLDNIFSRPSQTRHPWCQLFIAAVSKTSPLLESLLTERLSSIITKEDLGDLISLIHFSNSLVAYRCPHLVESILIKARSFGPAALEELRWDLIHSSQPTIRSYKNGILDNQYSYALTEAERAYAEHTSNPILGPFYLKIIEIEKADAERQKRLAEASLQTDWQ